MPIGLPPGIKMTEDVKGEVPVSIVGYFFKKYEYKADDKSKWRVNPTVTRTTSSSAWLRDPGGSRRPGSTSGAID